MRNLAAVTAQKTHGCTKITCYTFVKMTRYTRVKNF